MPQLSDALRQAPNRRDQQRPGQPAEQPRRSGAQRQENVGEHESRRRRYVIEVQRDQLACRDGGQEDRRRRGRNEQEILPPGTTRRRRAPCGKTESGQRDHVQPARAQVSQQEHDEHGRQCTPDGH